MKPERGVGEYRLIVRICHVLLPPLRAGAGPLGGTENGVENVLEVSGVTL